MAQSPVLLVSVRKPRSRLVYFRVSDEEFAQMTRICEAEGARSLSDLIRLTMERSVLNGSSPRGELESRLQYLDELIGRLRVQLHTLGVLLHEREQEETGTEEQGQ